MTVNDYLVPKIAERLRTIDANTLQIMAEDMAIIKFPGRFRSGTFHRKGRNLEAQTTKGWPDAYVATNANEFDAVEATRDVNAWKGHLEADLIKARTRGISLSGFFFVGGCSKPEVREDVSTWENQFAELGIPRSNITILVNRDLALELSRSEYARIRHHLLKLPTVPQKFLLLIPGLIGDPKLGDFQPSPEDFSFNRISKPKLLPVVVQKLINEGAVLVRGRGACGKTTLAQLVSVDSNILPAPTYYLDMAKHESAEIQGAVMNELVEFGAKGVLFIIDNVHLDERFAHAVYEHWNSNSRSEGANLLMLGRQTNSGHANRLGPLQGLKLIPGPQDLLGIVKRIFLQRQLTLPDFPAETVDQWITTFGGNADGDDLTVDLIAFGAAVERKLSNLSRGESMLSHKDAVDAVEHKYLRPIGNAREKLNLLRLAALADYEILLPKSTLPYPSTGFSIAKRELGIVDESVTPGRESRVVFSLVHAALGPLLTAATDDFDVLKERIEVARLNPAIGFQMTSSRRNENGHIVEAIRTALREPGWTKCCSSLDEWTTVIRGAFKKNFAETTMLEQELCQSLRERIASQQCSLISLTRLLLEAKRWHLKMCISAVYSSAETKLLTGLKNIIVRARPDEVANFLAIDKRGQNILMSLDANSWTEGQKLVPLFNWAETISACRVFEKLGRQDLAVITASALVRAAGSPMLVHMNLGLLSHLLRFCQNSLEEKREFLCRLTESGWLTNAVTNTTTTNLCGALMSFTNHLEKDLWPLLHSQELVTRVEGVMQKGWTTDKKNPLKQLKAKMVTICLLGGFSSFGGKFSNTFIPQLPLDIDLAALLESSLLRNEGKSLGMYELQFWLGLREFSQHLAREIQVPPTLAAAFQARLVASKAPTANAFDIQRGLQTWLAERSQRNWVLKDL